VKRVNGTERGGSEHLHCLSFSMQDATEIAKIDLFLPGYSHKPESVIGEDEQIIGIYGEK
jgi:hypothetical protein